VRLYRERAKILRVTASLQQSSLECLCSFIAGDGDHLNGKTRAATSNDSDRLHRAPRLLHVLAYVTAHQNSQPATHIGCGQGIIVVLALWSGAWGS
jgi:hypothetical protein